MEEDKYLELDFADETVGLPVNRREFLGAAGGGIFLFFTIGELPALAGEARRGRSQQSLPTDFNAFLKIGEDGRVTCYTGKIEMGQGNLTALSQTLADELEVPLEAVDMVMGDTDLCPWDGGTVGSRSIRNFAPALRAAAAEGKMVLQELASEHLKIPVRDLTAENGEVFEKKNRQNRVSYARLARGKRIERRLKQGAAVKKPSEFKVMGKPSLRREAGEKVTGRAKYAGDIQLPGMVYAKILRPPAHGAKLRDVDLSEAEKVPGLQIVREGDLVAVLHKYPDVAELALSKIKARFDKSPSTLNDKNIFDYLLKSAPQGNVLAKDGDLQKGGKGATIIEHTYLDGYVAHAPMEPHTAVVKIEGDKATVWSSTQAPFRVKDAVARELGIPPAKVRVFTPFVGGGFGGKSRNVEAVEAVRLAKLSGKPVQLAWSRKEEFFYDSFRPAAVVTIRSGVADKGNISLWDYHVYFAGDRGSPQFYNIPHHSTISHGMGRGEAGPHPFATGSWRAPANNTNTFARESQIDIMAHRLGIDPLEFRMRNLTDKKMQRVLKTAARKFGWKPAKAPSRRGWGIACGIDAGTYVATMAEVEVDKATGHVQVKRAVSVQDMGLAVNPAGAALQMEGCITMGLGYALKEHIRFNNGEIFDLNFDTYELPRFSWLPKIETVIIEDKDATPQGGGEPGIITMGGVIANAIFDAVGVRLFQMPMSPDSIKEALARA